MIMWDKWAENVEGAFSAFLLCIGGKLLLQNFM